MPTISIFIRKDDLPKWQALENKSEWLHQRLGGAKTLFEKAGTQELTEKKVNKVINGSNWSGPIMRDKKKGKL